MNKRLSRILFLAFIIAAVCSYLVYRVAGRQMNAPAPQQTSKILVATHDLVIGSVLHDADVKQGEWVGAAPKGAIVAKDAALNRGVTSTLYEGEPIFESRLAAAGSGGGLAATIRPGMRACAIKVDDVVGVAGFVVAGMRVDVLVSGTSPGGTTLDGPQVKTVLQNIEVLSAGTNIQKDNEGKPVQVPVVNLLVTPEQAEILSLASNMTRIQLVLRNPLDTDTTKTPGVGMTSLFSEGGRPKPAAPVKRTVVAKTASAPPGISPQPPRTFLVEVMNGGKRSEAKFTGSEQ